MRTLYTIIITMSLLTIAAPIEAQVPDEIDAGAAVANFAASCVAEPHIKIVEDPSGSSTEDLNEAQSSSPPEARCTLDRIQFFEKSEGETLAKSDCQRDMYPRRCVNLVAKVEGTGCTIYNEGTASAYAVCFMNFEATAQAHDWLVPGTLVLEGGYNSPNSCFWLTGGCVVRDGLATGVQISPGDTVCLENRFDATAEDALGLGPDTLSLWPEGCYEWTQSEPTEV